MTCRTSNLTTLQLIHFKGFSSGAYQKLFSFFRLIWESQINWQVSRLMIFLMIHNSPHTSYFMIQKEANQCRGWTTETYLSTVTDTVDLKWKLLLTLKKNWAYNRCISYINIHYALLGSLTKWSLSWFF